MNTVLLAAIYILVGFLTISILKRKKLKIACYVYAAAFFVLAFYIPVYSGFNLMTLIASTQLIETYAVEFEAMMQEPLIATLPFFAYSYKFVIIVSLFIMLSAAFVAVEVIRVLRRRTNRDFTVIPRRPYKKLDGEPKSGPDFLGARYKFCRYNC